jgi:hypothetical protein
VFSSNSREGSVTSDTGSIENRETQEIDLDQVQFQMTTIHSSVPAR